MSPDFAIMPESTTDVSLVTFSVDAEQNDTVGGYMSSAVTGGLLIQSPGLALPMLWHRGSLFNLGVFGFNEANPGNLPALNAFDFACSNLFDTPLYWDAPQSWGRQNYLVRRPRTLIIIGDFSELGNPDVGSWVNANYATTFAPLNLSVVYLIPIENLGSVLTGLMPLLASNTTSAVVNENYTLDWSMPTADTPFYVGGDCFVAILQDNILQDGFYLQSVSGTFDNPTPPPISPWSLSTATATVDSAEVTAGSYVNIAKAANDIAILNAGASTFNTFQLTCYQYNANPTSLAYINTFADLGTVTALSPSPIIADSVADTLLSGSDYTSRKTFTVGDSASMLAQLLEDVVAFFPALP
jgi:hypothetical protein